MQRRFLCFGLSGLLLIWQPMANAGDAKNGKALYDANCFKCHNTAIHTRPNSIILSLTALKNRVRFCETNAKLTWTDPQIDDVATYLNNSFYKFKQ